MSFPRIAIVSLLAAGLAARRASAVFGHDVLRDQHESRARARISAASPAPTSIARRSPKRPDRKAANGALT